jgi:hypothetical protein
MKKSLVAAVVCLLVSAFTVSAFASNSNFTPAGEKQAKTVGMLRMEQTKCGYHFQGCGAANPTQPENCFL